LQILKKTFSKNNNEIQLIGAEGAEGAKTILIIGVFHGEEPQGKFLIEKYISLKAEQINSKNSLLFISCLNPDGFAVRKRQNSNGVDLNRNFPTKNWIKAEKTSEYYGGENSASEIETKFVIQTLAEFSPDVILTLHAPYKVVNYDGPAKEIAEEISKIIGYRTLNDIGYPTPGNFGNYAGVERKIPTITLELDEEKELEELIKPVFKIFDYLGNY